MFPCRQLELIKLNAVGSSCSSLPGSIDGDQCRFYVVPTDMMPAVETTLLQTYDALLHRCVASGRIVKIETVVTLALTSPAECLDVNSATETNAGVVWDIDQCRC